jgi:hypothetical protein
MKHSVRDVGVAGSNPATPTTRFTKRFKRLVNFLKLRKNIKQSRWHTCGTARLVPTVRRRESDGIFKCAVKAAGVSHTFVPTQAPSEP